MDMLGKVRRMKMRDKLTISEISKRTGLARNTVKRWLKAPGDVSPKYLRRSDPTKLSAYEATLVMALKADAHRHKDGRRTARALFVQITAQGYRGGYSAVTDFIRAWRSDSGKATKAFVPLAFENGEAFQFDWSEEGMLVGGVFHKVQAAHLKLCASRAFWLVAYPTQSHEMLFDAHTRSFAALGGVPHRGIYDNMKTAVDEVLKGKGRVVNARFKAMCSHYLFDPDFCNVASGWEKGRVEKNVQDSRRRIWIEARERRFGSFVELNVWLSQRCRAIWAETAHPDLAQFTIAEMLEIEREHLMAMPEAFDGYVERSSRVSSTCLVTVALGSDNESAARVNVPASTTRVNMRMACIWSIAPPGILTTGGSAPTEPGSVGAEEFSHATSTLIVVRLETLQWCLPGLSACAQPVHFPTSQTYPPFLHRPSPCRPTHLVPPRSPTQQQPLPRRSLPLRAV